MLMVNALDHSIKIDSSARAVSQGYNLGPITPVSIPELEPEAYVFDSSTGNAEFNVEWTGGGVLCW